ncbi:MAG: sugar transferase [Ruminococcus sp.]|nr:sugar transferase [Ruminococcus sp.]
MYQKGTRGLFKSLYFLIQDIICINVSFIFTYLIARHFLSYNMPGEDYYKLIIILNVTAVLVSVFSKAYSKILERGYWQEMVSVITYSVLVFLVALFFYYVLGESFIKGIRNRSLITLIIFMILSYTARAVSKNVIKARMKNRKTRSLLVVTTKVNAENTIKKLVKGDTEGFNISGLIISDEDMTGQKISGIEVVANEKYAADYVCRRWVDEVFIDFQRDEYYPAKLISEFETMGLAIHTRIFDTEEVDQKSQMVEKIGGFTVLTTSLNYASAWQLFVKRFADILGGIFGCIMTGILFIFVAPLIYIKSPGPIFFKQIRVGKNGKKFKLYKFRTMYTDAEERKKDLVKKNRVKDGMMFKIKHDERIIGCKVLSDGTVKKGLGGWLRALSIDEFPQFFNVLKGDMSLVGTRPPTLDEWGKYELHHRARLAIKPGITGLWQVSGRSEITDFEEVVKLDTQYIREWRIILDIKILFKTVVSVFKREGSM